MARILLIDDDEAVRSPTARLLELMGHEVLTAEHGEAGLKIWREQGADLVITDLCMPDISGLELIVQLRAFATSRFSPCRVVWRASGAGTDVLQDGGRGSLRDYRRQQRGRKGQYVLVPVAPGTAGKWAADPSLESYQSMVQEGKLLD